MSKPGSTSESLLDLCKHSERSIKDLVEGEILLNQKQCQDLSSKLSEIISNIEELASYSGAPIVSFEPALEKLYRCLEKAKLLVTNCAEKDWCAAAVFQCQNQNAFREIFLDVGFCYNAIYEQAKSKRKDWNDATEDLRQSSLFDPATDCDALEDKQDLQKRLDELASAPTKLEGFDKWIPGRESQKQSLVKYLAKYLLVKMYFTSKEPLANNLDRHSPILWMKGSEPPGTWGNSRLLGFGAGAAGVCATTWLGIPCAKKEFHDQEFEGLFLKEAGISARMKHPSVIDFISCGNGSEKGDRFIAMEHMQMNLFNLIQKQGREHFSVAVAVDMMVQMARGVWYLHGQGVAHRDLKPQNVVVNRLSVPHVEDHYCVKLVDFGVSKTEVEVSKLNTMTYRGIGTTMYRAPEAHPKANEETKGIGKVNWFKADAFSFAMTCAHLLSLETPFKDTMPNDLFRDLNEGIRPEVLDHVYPKELISILKDCWHTDPRARPSFARICTRLEEFQLTFMMGYSSVNKEMKEENVDVGEGIDYIKKRLGTSTKGPLDDEVEDETIIDHMAILRCFHNHALELLPQQPSIYKKKAFCYMCWKDINGNIYHCKTCQFDAHSYCAKINDKVKASFHDHYLHLLVQNYYSDEPDAICSLCEESLQESEWVYKCEECDFDLHPMCAKLRDISRKTVHPHSLTLIQCPPGKSLVCTRCNGEIKKRTWRYTCGRKTCAFNLHPLCTIRPWNPLCIFDTSHRLSLIRQQSSFYCSRCGAQGFSWKYHCSSCAVDIHPDCVDADYDVKGGWIKDYEKLMMENGSKDNQSEIVLISELLDMVPVNDALEASSSAESGTPQVTMRVQPSLQRLSLAESPSLDASKDVDLQRQIATATKERIKATKTAAKEARQKVRARLLEVLDSVERIVLDMQSFESMSHDDAEALTATHKKLKSRQALVKERMAMQVQSKMGQGPRIAVFSLQMTKGGRIIGRELLTNLQADMKGVCFALLCEEPGHEHIVDGKVRIWNGRLGEEFAEKLQPLVAPGLQVVREAMRTLEPHELTALESVTLSCLGNKPWDLRAIARFEEHGNESSDPISEDTEQAESLQRAVDSAAEWLRSVLEDGGVTILEKMGLQRVRYKVSEESDDPRYRRCSMAWLCSDHVSSVTMRVQPSLQRLSLAESPSLDASKDVDLQRQIATATKERIKATKTAAKEARQKLRARLLEVLDSVERIVLDMQCFESMSHDDAEALTATHKKLKSRQALVKERMAMQVQSKMGQGPRIAVFYLKMTKGGRIIGRELLTNLQADMKGVCFALLCEEPGHEHIVDGKFRKWYGRLGEEKAEKLQPLLAPGLQVVREAMRTLEPHELTALESVTLSCLGNKPWDLRAIARFEEHGNESSDPISEDTEQAESLQRAVDSAAEWFRSYLENDVNMWFRSYLENDGVNISEEIGLQRVRYKVSEESDDPRYRRCSMAWLCSDHVSSGLEAGTLESAPLKYYDVEVDYELRFPHVKKLK